MDKAIIGATLSVLALGAVDLERPGQPPPSLVLPDKSEPRGFVGQPNNLRNLLLHAFGVGEAQPGQIRVPIPTSEGVTYEVIVAKPGLPRAVPVVNEKDAD